MTMLVTYQSADYTPEKVVKRYLRYGGAYQWHWCEVGEDRRYDIRQGVSDDMRDFPVHIANEAVNLKMDGITPSWVEWPMHAVWPAPFIPLPAPPEEYRLKLAVEIV